MQRHQAASPARTRSKQLSQIGLIGPNTSVALPEGSGKGPLVQFALLYLSHEMGMRHVVGSSSSSTMARWRFGAGASTGANRLGRSAPRLRRLGADSHEMGMRHVVGSSSSSTMTRWRFGAGASTGASSSGRSAPRLRRLGAGASGLGRSASRLGRHGAGVLLARANRFLTSLLVWIARLDAKFTPEDLASLRTADF